MTSPPDVALFPPPRWLPKITPYRVAFILTTAGLGIAKAVLVSRDETASSITVEWITGVAVALVFQFFGPCEYNDMLPPTLNWLFQHNIIGWLTGTAARAHPGYNVGLETENRLSVGHLSDVPPLVTGYRLFVSALFAAFGLAKMLCGYLGLSTAMNTLDWVIGVPLALAIYCIGLHEENKSRALRKFFDVDYLPQVTLAFNIGLFLATLSGAAALCILWIRYWLGPLHAAFKNHGPLLESPFKFIETWLSSVSGAIANHVAKWSVVALYLMLLEIGAIGLGVTLWPLIKVFGLGRRLGNLLRNYTLITAFLSLYFLATFLALGVFAIQVSISIPVYDICLQSDEDGARARTVRILLPLIMLGITVVSGIPVVFFVMGFVGLFDTFRCSFLGRV